MNPEPEDEATGLRGLRTWRGVYVVVLCVFLAWVGLLTLLDRAFP
jgi:hypothetical protein